MKGKLRKFLQIALLAVILGAALLPSVVLAQASGSPAPAAASSTPAATTPATTTPPATVPSSQTADAGTLANIVVRGIASLVGVLIELFGKLTIQLIDILVRVAQYNSYMDSPAISTGWTIIRDVANLFFVALILVVSIGSIVNPDKFGGTKQVFRILLFALFVNFSRFIAALCIDVSQLVMLTFVNGFAQAAGGNFTEALGVTKLTELAAGGALTPTAALAGIFMALFMFVVITVIIGVMVVALIVRMVTLWVLVVTSPLAFACGASSITKKHYDDWWKQFTAELTTGPIVAFFLWLSLVSLQGTTGSGVTGQVLQGTTGGNAQVNISCGEIAACSEENMIRFIVAAAMLLTGLGFAKQFGGVGGELAKKAGEYGGKNVRTAVDWAARKAAWPAAGYLVGGGIGAASVGGITLASQSPRVKAFMGKTLAGGNAVGNTLNKIPGLRFVTSRAGRSLTASAYKDTSEVTAKAEATVKPANVQQLLAMAKGVGVDMGVGIHPAVQMAARAKLLGKPEKETGWDDKKKLEETKILEAYYKKTNNKDGTDLVEGLKKKNPMLVDPAETAKDSKGTELKRPDGSLLPKREQYVQKLADADLADLDVNAVRELVGLMKPSQREYVKKNGGQNRTNEVRDWERNNPPDPAVYADQLKTGKLRTDDVSDIFLENPQVAVSLSADEVAGKMSEVLKSSVNRDAFKNGTEDALNNAPNNRLDQTNPNQYNPNIQKAAEGHLRAGGRLDKAFRVDATGHFNNVAATADKDAFTKALQGKNFSDVTFAVDPALLASNVTNEVKEAIVKEIDLGRLTVMQQAARADGNVKKLAIVDAVAKAKHEALSAIPVANRNRSQNKQIDNLETKFNI